MFSKGSRDIHIYMSNTGNWSTDESIVLPKELYGHCVVAINETTVFITGGIDTTNPYNKSDIRGSSESYIVNVESGAWYQGPNLPVPIYGHSCLLMEAFGSYLYNHVIF